MCVKRKEPLFILVCRVIIFPPIKLAYGLLDFFTESFLQVETSSLKTKPPYLPLIACMIGYSITLLPEWAQITHGPIH